ncbi:prepilin-type N-terminal cleavage/methylation domain-containing protein [Candidatus Stoquefichus massiliensis]|uniref:prepilin-type N-terminal cleavage/methylation domain-containing protein n=1 Tax=Candidatus Stoquefichus massiliensis TaxID=1470350 RepID=UPI0004B07565|nr:prepilin-type N-terminal cleavage/methylation domain-containing protein [Candidatus Stoquefichus massiliensis]
MNIKKLRELKKNKKGFTLIEIIVVVVILAVLLAVAVPSVLNYLNEADDAKYQAQARGAMIVAQKEASTAFINKDTTNIVSGVWTAPEAAINSVGGKPAVTGIKATLDSKGNIKEIIVEFADKTVKIDPNEKMTITNNKSS